MVQFDYVIRDFAHAGPRISPAMSLRAGGLAVLLTMSVSTAALCQQSSAPIASALHGGAPAVVAATTTTSSSPAVAASAAPVAQPAASAMPPVAQPGAVLPPVAAQPAAAAGAAQLPAGSPAASAASGVPATTPEETNPFSNVKPTTDQQALKQDIPALEQRLKRVEAQVSAIQQVQVAVPAGALSMGPSGHPVAGAPGPMDEESVELQAATFIACVNGKAMFRDSDQKPFFVDAKEASENEAVRRVGGCKH